MQIIKQYKVLLFSQSKSERKSCSIKNIKCHWTFYKVSNNLGGLDLSRSCLDRDSWSRHWQRAGLDSRENLDTFKKLVSILSRHHLPVPKVSIEIEKSVETWNFWQISTVCLNLDRELVNFITFLNRDFWICQHFGYSSTAKSW